MNSSILFGLAAGTLVSEDLTLISAGLLARDGAVGVKPALAACAAGVYVGDLGLWMLGRIGGRRALRWKWVARRVDPAMLTSLGAHLDVSGPRDLRSAPCGVRRLVVRRCPALDAAPSAPDSSVRIVVDLTSSRTTQ